MDNKIIIFGASLKGRLALDISNYIDGFDVFAFADNSIEKQKSLFMGLPVLSAEEAVESGLPILLASMFKYEIVEQLRALGCEKCFFSYRDMGLELSENQVNELEEITSYIHYANLHELLYDFEVEEYHSKALAEKNKIVFCCDTAYQFLTCIFLSKLHFKDKSCILLIGDRVEALNDIVKKNRLDMFSSIIHFNHDYRLQKNEFNKIAKSLEIPEKFIFFDDSFMIVRKLMRVIADNTMSIMADEGFYSYSELRLVQRDNKTFDKMRVDEFWMYNKSLFELPKEGAVVQEITYNPVDVKSIVNEINNVFGYTYKRFDSDIIYFDYYGRGHASNDGNMKFFKKIENTLKNYSVEVKPHPSEDIDKYSSSHMPLLGGSFESSRFPWELYEINNIMEDKGEVGIYISVCSTASLFNYMFASFCRNVKKNRKVIFIYKLFETLVEDQNINFKQFNDFILRIGNDNIFIPETFEELDNILQNIANRRNT